MNKPKQFWFLRNWQAWIVLGMGCITALVTAQAWVVTLGIIGYLLVLLFEAGLDPRSLVRMAHAEQENRTLKAERHRILDGSKELQARNAALETANQQLKKELESLRAEIAKLKGQAITTEK